MAHTDLSENSGMIPAKGDRRLHRIDNSICDLDCCAVNDHPYLESCRCSWLRPLPRAYHKHETRNYHIKVASRSTRFVSSSGRPSAACRSSPNSGLWSGQLGSASASTHPQSVVGPGPVSHEKWVNPPNAGQRRRWPRVVGM